MWADVGTLNYMSPEVLGGSAPGQAPAGNAQSGQEEQAKIHVSF